MFALGRRAQWSLERANDPLNWIRVSFWTVQRIIQFVSLSDNKLHTNSRVELVFFRFLFVFSKSVGCVVVCCTRNELKEMRQKLLASSLMNDFEWRPFSFARHLQLVCIMIPFGKMFLFIRYIYIQFVLLVLIAYNFGKTI